MSASQSSAYIIIFLMKNLCFYAIFMEMIGLSSRNSFYGLSDKKKLLFLWEQHCNIQEDIATHLDTLQNKIYVHGQYATIF